MKKLFILLVLVVIPFLVLSKEVKVYNDTFFTAGLFTMVMVILLSFLVLFIIAFTFTMLLLIIFLGLILFGIISTSLVWAVYQKSLEKGFKLFILSLCTSYSTIIGCIAGISWFKIMHWPITIYSVGSIVITSISSGLLIGICTFYLLKKLLKRLSKNN